MTDEAMFLQSVADGDYKAVRSLVGKIRSVNIADADGETPLMIAIGRRHLDIVKLLLDWGAEPHLQNKSGGTVWDCIVTNRDGAIASIFSERGIQPAESKRRIIEDLVINYRAAGDRDVKLCERCGKNFRLKSRGGRTAQALCESCKATSNGEFSGGGVRQEQSSTSQANGGGTVSDNIAAMPEPLMQVATVLLYRQNPFRLLGVPISASVADVRRQQKRLEMKRKLGQTDTGENGVFALVPPPADEDLSSALERLSDPQVRLLDEIFWFWRTREYDHTNIADFDVDAARRAWSGSASGANGLASLHNLAVLDHLTALDLEVGSGSGKFPEAEKNGPDRLWASALNRWSSVLASDHFSEVLKGRIRELNDARLTTGFTRRIRESMPYALLSINASLALRAAEEGRQSTAERHIRIIKESPFEESVKNTVIRNALSPIRTRLKVLCEDAKRKSQSDPKTADAAGRDVHRAATEALSIVDQMTPDTDPIRQGLHDSLAQALDYCATAHWNETRDVLTVVDLLESATQLAVEQALRDRLNAELEDFRRQAEALRCFFCAQCNRSPDAAVVVALHNNVCKVDTGTSTYSLRWTHFKVTVPRCTTCKAFHDAAAKRSIIGFLLFSICGFLLGYLLDAFGLSNEVGTTFITAASAILGAVAGAKHHRTPYPVKPFRARLKFKQVAEDLASGSQLGDGLSEAERAEWSSRPASKAEWTFGDGGKYEGDLVNGAKTGHGVYTWASGDRYEGDFKDGELTGRGVYTYADGGRYEGEFKDGKLTGRGVYTYADGGRYEGEFKDGKRTGRGVYTYAPDGRYEGEFKDGREIGGWYFFPSGNKEWHWRDRNGKWQTGKEGWIDR